MREEMPEVQGQVGAWCVGLSMLACSLLIACSEAGDKANQSGVGGAAGMAADSKEPQASMAEPNSPSPRGPSTVSPQPSLDSGPRVSPSPDAGNTPDAPVVTDDASLEAGPGDAGMAADAATDAGWVPSSSGITAVCSGGTVGLDSESTTTDPLTVSREFAAVKYFAPLPNKILSLKTTMLVPTTPSTRQTLFLWPGLQSKQGAADPAGIGNGVLQPVLTWGPSCAPRAPRDSFGAWWMAGMYVNVTTGAAGLTGCAGGDYMTTEVGDLLEIDMSVEATAWTQTITDLRTMESVDFTIHLEGQVQNTAMWVIEVPSGTTVRPSEDLVFTESVLTFESPVASCQPSQAGAADYFSAPARSPDGLHCCFESIILRAER